MDLASQLVDRTDYIRTFATHVSHELKSPLTAIRGAAELLRDDEPDLPMTPEQRATSWTISSRIRNGWDGC